MKAINKETSEEVKVFCWDDYFGRHRYGYKVGDTILTHDEFFDKYKAKENE
jgi:hypothetical protein